MSPNLPVDWWWTVMSFRESPCSDVIKVPLPSVQYSLLSGHTFHAYLDLLAPARYHVVSPELQNLPTCRRRALISLRRLHSGGLRGGRLT